MRDPVRLQRKKHKGEWIYKAQRGSWQNLAKDKMMLSAICRSVDAPYLPDFYAGFRIVRNK